MVAGVETQANSSSFQLEEHVCTAIWGRGSPEGPCGFQGTSPDSLSPPEAAG
jgi:hypothetical protein